MPTNVKNVLLILMVFFLNHGTAAAANEDEILGFPPTGNDMSDSFPGGYIDAIKIEVKNAGQLQKFGVHVNGETRARMYLFSDTVPYQLLAVSEIFPLTAGMNYAEPTVTAHVEPGFYFLGWSFEDDVPIYREVNGANVPGYYTAFDFQSTPGPVNAWNVYDGFPYQVQLILTSPFDSHTCLVSAEKNYCFGSNKLGQLGLGHTDGIGDDTGETAESFLPVNLGTDFKVRKSVTGGRHSCALSTDAKLKCWGGNNFGQLGLGDTIPRGQQPAELGDALPYVKLPENETIKDISSGLSHTCALSAAGKVYCWGANTYGQLGLGDNTPRSAPTKSIDFGSNSEVKLLVAGKNHNCVVLANNNLKCWGMGSGGQLGLENKNNRGDKMEHMGDNLSAVNVGTEEEIIGLNAGYDFTCTLFRNGSVKCFGQNKYGSLGIGDAIAHGDDPGEMGTKLPFLDFGVGQRIKNLSCGNYHCCALFVQNTLKCWGSNNAGGLGLGDRMARGDKPTDMGDNLAFVRTGDSVITQLRLGSGLSCLMNQDDKWKCWGNNSSGQLGLGDKTDRGTTDETIPENLGYLHFQ